MLNVESRNPSEAFFEHCWALAGLNIRGIFNVRTRVTVDISILDSAIR